MQQFDDKIETSASLIPLRAEIRGERKLADDKLTEQMVCGHVAVVNDNEQIKAKLIDSFAALATLPFSGVVYFDTSNEIGIRLMGLFFNEHDLMGVTPVVLKAYPGAAPTAAFDQFSWDTLSVAYSDLVSDIVSTTRVDKMMREEAGERQKRPPKEQLLTKDRVKHFDAFDAVEGEDDDDHGE